MKSSSHGRKSPASTRKTDRLDQIRPPPTNITRCSFCGKSHAEVKKLIAGRGVYICDNCVILCKNVLDKELVAEPKKPAAVAPQVPKPAEIKRHLDLHCV